MTTSKLQFAEAFKAGAEAGDTITLEVGNVTFTATLHEDDQNDAPDQNDDGFWPSIKPEDAGYVPPENFNEQWDTAVAVMAAWKAGEWTYVGVSVTASLDMGEHEDVPLTSDYEFALWGIEDGRYPGSDGAYLTETANEYLAACIPKVLKCLRDIENTVGSDRRQLEREAGL